MRDGEWAISHAGGTATFGLLDNDAFLVSYPEVSDYEITNDDAGIPRGDGVMFGYDYHGGVNITLNLKVMRDTEAETRQAVSTLARLWRGDAIRTTPGAVAQLRTRQAGRERMTYGRPRRWAVDDSQARWGVVDILCDFTTVDDTWQDLSSSGLVASLAPSYGGGFTTPVTTPITTSTSSDRRVTLNVVGEAATWPWFDIAGPVTNPTIGIAGLWEIKLNISIAAGQSVRVDTRPNFRGVRYNGGVSLSGSVATSSSPLSKAYVPVGVHTLMFTGIDQTGQASVTVNWRNTYTSL